MPSSASHSIKSYTLSLHDALPISRAMSLVQELMKTSKTTVVGETMAMALAETGQFSDAADVQRGVLAAAEQAGIVRDVRRMAANLRSEEHTSELQSLRHLVCRLLLRTLSRATLFPYTTLFRSHAPCRWCRS